MVNYLNLIKNKQKLISTENEVFQPKITAELGRLCCHTKCKPTKPSTFPELKLKGCLPSCLLNS